jgi:hypothetical protein
MVSAMGEGTKDLHTAVGAAPPAEFEALSAEHRVDGLIRTAHEHDMWSEALDLISHLNLANRAELADHAAAQDDDLLDSLIRTVQRMGIWDDMLPVLAAMSPHGLRRLVDLALRGEIPDEVRHLVRDRARELGRPEIAAAFDEAVPRPRPRPGPGRRG